ncbi:MAG: hypothetical protein NVV68_11875 [Dokdonella sp.]|nr:hypothetical protein [Dokdonella sp.]
MESKSRFSGRLDVSDDAFVLVAKEILIFPNDHIGFIFIGEDGAGPFRCEGVAIWAESARRYVASQVKMASARSGRADIFFTRIGRIDDQAWEIEGVWQEDGLVGSPWHFSGEVTAP